MTIKQVPGTGTCVIDDQGRRIWITPIPKDLLDEIHAEAAAVADRPTAPPLRTND